jgi:hypothetical protein
MKRAGRVKLTALFYRFAQRVTPAQFTSLTRAVRSVRLRSALVLICGTMKWDFDDIIILGLFGAALGAIGHIAIALALYAVEL